MSEEKNIEVPLSLLSDVVNIIDMVSERGAFKGAEMATVGNIRNWCVDKIKRDSEEGAIGVSPEEVSTD